MKGLISRLLDHSFVDGPGNRAVIFFQGCPLRCLYCHNPQTQAGCNGCGLCVSGCPGGALQGADETGGGLRWSADRCQGCDRCIQVCPHRADPRARWYSVDDLLDWLRSAVPFLSGITLSGGEPLLQPAFSAALLASARGLGLTGMVESSAAVPFDVFRPLLPVLDGVLADLKVWDEAQHRALTGVGNQMIKENLRRLAGAGKLAEVRVPVIPGFSDTPANVAATAAFVAELDPAIPLRLQRFRAHGTRGPAAQWRSPGDEQMAQLMQAVRAAGLRNVTRSH